MKVDGPLLQMFDLPQLENNYSTTSSLQHQTFVEGLGLSSNQAELYEIETRQQSNDRKWHELKSQRLSSSKFKDVNSRKKDFDSLAKRLLKKTKQTEAMRHGIETEEDAASAYADITDHNVYPCAIVINPSSPHLATSPDRRVYDPSLADPWGLLEIKCPIKDTITEMPYLKCLTGTYKLKKTHNYYHQVMGQILLTGAKWVDFFVWCNLDFHLERITFDPVFSKEMKKKLDLIHYEYSHLNGKA